MKSAALAMSSGCQIGVLTVPRPMQLTRMPCTPYRVGRFRVRSITPVFAAQYGSSLVPVCPLTELTVEIADTPYGITMGSDAVSQVLSLRLSGIPLDDDVDIRDLPAVSAGVPVR